MDEDIYEECYSWEGICPNLFLQWYLQINIPWNTPLIIIHILTDNEVNNARLLPHGTLSDQKMDQLPKEIGPSSGHSQGIDMRYLPIYASPYVFYNNPRSKMWKKERHLSGFYLSN